MDDPTASAAASERRRIRPLEWAVIGLFLGLAVVLLLGGLLPARARSGRALERGLGLADEILRTQEEIGRLRRSVHDLANDPLTLERILREKGALAPGEVPVPGRRRAPLE